VVVRSSLGRGFVLRLDFDCAALSINFKDEGAFIQMPFLFSFEKGAALPCAEDV